MGSYRASDVAGRLSALVLGSIGPSSFRHLGPMPFGSEVSLWLLSLSLQQRGRDFRLRKRCCRTELVILSEPSWVFFSRLALTS
jgi:hypothetical protein